MNISPDQARESLAEIDLTMRASQLDAARSASVPLLTLWGAIWLIYPLLIQFLAGSEGWSWGLFPLGGLASWIIGARGFGVATNPSDTRIGYCWCALFAFAGVWIFLLQPRTPEQGYAFGCTVPMLFYVIGGLWFGKFFSWLGIAITALTVLGYLYAGHYFWLWMGLMGGGALLLSALYIHLTWRVRGA